VWLCLIKFKNKKIYMKTFKSKKFKPSAQQGVTLIELMVALVIGLIVSLAVYTVLVSYEGRKRTTTSVNDIDQTASYASYMIDKSLRSAGTGFTGGLNPKSTSSSSNSLPLSAANYTFGCLLKTSLGAAVLVPKAAIYPAPFALAPMAVRLAPIVILDEAGTNGDVLITMGGSGGLSESVNNLNASPTSSAITLTNVAGFTANDKMLLLATSNSSALAGTACLVEQVVSNFVQGTGTTYTVGLANGASDYRVDPTSYPSITTTAIAFNLGKSPSFYMFGVGANNTLFRYDMLLPSGTNNPSQFADSVYSMQAIYGVGATKGALVWTAPTGAYASANLLDGSAAANLKLQNIKAVRIALIMRTSLPEKVAVSPATLKVFESTGVDTTVTVALASPNYRYRVVESTIPIRNALALD
jgi:type IV pilus assembly protein PilW